MTLHNVIMNNKEYLDLQGILDRMERDKVFAQDAERIRKILQKDTPVEDKGK